MASTPQRITRSRSSAPTVPGPPILSQSLGGAVSDTSPAHSNPFGVDLVISYDISVSPRSERAKEAADIKEGYERLLRALEGEGGLRVATRSRPANSGRKGKKTAGGGEEVWVFVSAEEGKMEELVERESLLDQAHNLPPHPSPHPPSPATRLRLLYNLLTAPPLQDGLGITPGEGAWKRIKGIAALHDEAADSEWVKRWGIGGDWGIGLINGLNDGPESGLGQHQPPPVHLYFDFLTTYTLSLLPLSLLSTLFYFLTPADSYPPLYALLLSLYSTAFIAAWRIKERKLAVRWGTRGCESVAVGRLRPEYVANLGIGEGAKQVDAVRTGSEAKRDGKILASVPVIAACGFGLGCVLMGIFVLEAFVSEAYEGLGKQVVPFVPTALFVLVVPQIIAAYGTLSKMLVKWEDHPTPVGAEKSLTAKTFAMNGIVAYLGLFLSAYVYVPFGPIIMAKIQGRLAKSETANVKFAKTPEKAGLGPKMSGGEQKGIKAGRLKGQLFAYTVTNQVVNVFLELGLPFILRFVNDWRAGKTTIKEAVKRGTGTEEEKPATSESDVEQRFLEKVERELELPDYTLFTDYAEMVTQFGYVTIWSIVWPLAPVFAFVNNYFELRTDAIKICKHVRRPIGDRVETIGSWLDTLGIIAWLGAVTNATLIYLFRPSTHLVDQTPNPNLPTHGSAHLASLVASYDLSPTWRAILPTLIPLVALALAASHGYIVLKWIVDAVAERVLWNGSAEEREVQRMRERGSEGVKQKLAELGKREFGRGAGGGGAGAGGFWNGGEEGGREIGRVLKAE